MTNPPLAEHAGIVAFRDDPDIRGAAGWFAANKAWILERQLEICRVAAPTFLEQQRGEFLQSLFQSLGYESSVDPVGNVMASQPLSPKQGLLVISAHMDTVLAPRRPDDIRLDPDGTLWGPGVADNGAGLSGLVALAQVMLEVSGAPLSGASRLEAPASFVANVGEEGEGNLTGMRYLCSDSALASRIAAILVLDGPGHEHITCRALASKRFELSFQGKGGHSWSDFGTVNPVHGLARAVALFADSNSPARGKQADRYSINVGIIQGGSSINSIPQSAFAKVDIRSERESLIDELVGSLTRCVEQSLAQEHSQAKRGKLTAKLKEIGSRPGGSLHNDSSLLRAMLAVDRELGIRSVLDTSSTDANIPLSLGIPAMALGAGGSGGGAHTTEEWYRPEGRDLGLRRAFLIACAMAAGIGVGEPGR